MSAKLEQLEAHGRFNLVPDQDPVEAKNLPAPVKPIDEPVVRAAGGRKRSSLRRRGIILGVLVLALVVAAGWGEYWWAVGRFQVSTDNAYVYAYNTTLAAKVPGYLKSFLVADNARVNAGDLIAIIDDGDYRLAVESARGRVASQEATIARIGRQTAASQASVEQALAQLASAQAAIIRADAEFARQRTLAEKNFASHQALETAQANRDQASAAVAGARAALSAAVANVEVTKAQGEEAERALAELRVALSKTERDLAFTEIRAPMSGVIGNRAVQTGDYVQTGQRLASLVPLHAVYIKANFKETQLARLRAGQKASIKVDALPGRVIEGTVDSMAPASGAIFTLLPPDNATGNFTKIVQRVPVHVGIPADVAEQAVLRPGMSVVVSVNTKPDAGPQESPPSPGTLPHSGIALGSN